MDSYCSLRKISRKHTSALWQSVRLTSLFLELVNDPFNLKFCSISLISEKWWSHTSCLHWKKPIHSNTEAKWSARWLWTNTDNYGKVYKMVKLIRARPVLIGVPQNTGMILRHEDSSSSTIFETIGLVNEQSLFPFLRGLGMAYYHSGVLTIQSICLFSLEFLTFVKLYYHRLVSDKKSYLFEKLQCAVSTWIYFTAKWMF